MVSAFGVWLHSSRGHAMSTSSACTVLNTIGEHFKGYISTEDLYTLLEQLFPNVARRESFQLNVRSAFHVEPLAAWLTRTLQTRNRRWTFYAPATVSDEDIRYGTTITRMFL